MEPGVRSGADRVAGARGDGADREGVLGRDEKRSQFSRLERERKRARAAGETGRTARVPESTGSPRVQRVAEWPVAVN